MHRFVGGSEHDHCMGGRHARPGGRKLQPRSVEARRTSTGRHATRADQRHETGKTGGACQTTGTSGHTCKAGTRARDPANAAPSGPTGARTSDPARASRDPSARAGHNAGTGSTASGTGDTAAGSDISANTGNHTARTNATAGADDRRNQAAVRCNFGRGATA